MTPKTRVHDGIVGAIVLLGVSLGLFQSPVAFYIVGATAALMISSAFTGFCPIYYVLDRVMKDKPKGG